MELYAQDLFRGIPYRLEDSAADDVGQNAYNLAESVVRLARNNPEGVGIAVGLFLLYVAYSMLRSWSSRKANEVYQKDKRRALDIDRF